MSGDERLDEWICEGKMEKDAIMDRCFPDPDDSSYRRDLVNIFREIATRSRGEWCISEKRFAWFLCQNGVIPSSLQIPAAIIYQSLLYLSCFPFVRKLPKGMTIQEICRAHMTSIVLEHSWNLRLRGGPLSRHQKRADRDRILFQSLATTRDGRKLSFDAEEWSRRAARRLSELNARGSNFDEFGDEMYYDTLDYIFNSQEPLTSQPVDRDHFRGLARELHGNDLHLHHLSIPRDRFRCLVKLLLLCQFGNTGDMDIRRFPDLDRVVDSIVRPFFRIVGVGITWPMFDDAIRLMPCLLYPIFEMALSFYGALASDSSSSGVERLLKESGSSLTFARCSQLNLFLGNDFVWKRPEVLRRYEPPCDVICMFKSLAATDSLNSVWLAVLLIYGKVSHTGEVAMFGAVIPRPSHDGSAPHDATEDYDHMRPCCLFELCPGHDVSRKNVGRPGWTVSWGRVCFGDPEDGAAMVLEANMTRATLIKNVNQRNPVYSVSPWRENGRVEVCIESFEVWTAPRSQSYTVMD